MYLKKYLKQIAKGMAVRLNAVPQAAWPWLAREAVMETPAAVLVVAPDVAAVDDLAAALGALCPARRVMPLPTWDVQPYDRLSPSAAVQAARLAVVQALAAGEAPVIVGSIPALAMRLPRDVEAPLTLRKDEAYPQEELARALTRMGYTRVEQVQDVGEWARRGGVVDIWPAAELPLRLEFFDDEIERMAVFDPAGQRTVETINEVVLGQVKAVVPDAAKVETFRRRYREMFEGATDDMAYAQVSEGHLPAHAGQLTALFWGEALPSIFDLLPDDTLLMAESGVGEQAALWEDTVRDAFAARMAAPGEGENRIRAVPPEAMALAAAEMEREMNGLPRLVVSTFDDGDKTALRPAVRGHDFLVAKSNRHAAAQAAAKEVLAKVAEGYHVVLAAPSAQGLNLMLKALEGEGAPPARLEEDVAHALQGTGGVVGTVAPFAHGWVSPADKLLVIAEADVFGVRLGGVRPRRKKRAEEMIAHFAELREGDYVVHEKHGIGRFAGLTTMTLDGHTQDFIKLLYAGDDRLFVPVENLDVLSRYKGAESGTVTLDKLGGSAWENRKARVKEDLMAMADDLLRTAAARETTHRPPLVDVANEGIYAEFCAGFPYDLTEDQQRVLEEVEADFAATHPMDRLVVGDVGFGKTEVALRAAYLAAAAGRQVAVVCPTTLLARQHYDVFTQRFAGFPMQVGRLSRLVSAAETKETKKRLAEGTLDIVIGTHALLGKGIAFKNLGLVVVDEEQRFGVAHKERLKDLRANVDVLTLTATPIPRTLQMAVGGVRQLSLITTPPVDRQAVSTFVLPWDNKTIAEAVRRETTRGGQVYVVAPHIDDLPDVQDSLAALIPNLRIGVAHGQLPEGELEKVMGAFYEGRLDVLLATTIIESGLDVAKANTLIVYRADRFGLAQLYQLRGRVGRSTRHAFAYFLLPEGPLTADATKRLTILQRLTDLGAGFTLASYDMDIRGFGNLLGKQQSGNIRDIGFELYNKLLREAVAERQKSKVDHRPSMVDAMHAASVTLKLGISYLIPDAYVPDVAERLQLYRRLANIKTAEGLVDFREELTDRCGTPPPEVECLLAVMGLRNRAEALNVSRIEVGEKGVLVAFENGAFANPASLMKHIMAHAGVITVRPDQSLLWHRRVQGDVLGGVGGIVEALEGLAPSQ